jgi:hypothetical protein
MMAASSREALRRAFVGIGIEIQGTDDSEVAHETGAVFLSPPPFPSSPLANVLTFYFTSAGQSNAQRKVIVLLYTPPRPSIRLQEYKGFTEVPLEIKAYHITEQYMTDSILILIYGCLWVGIALRGSTRKSGSTRLQLNQRIDSQFSQKHPQKKEVG